MASNTLLSLDCRNCKRKKKLHRKHSFLQSTLITRIKAETFGNGNDSIARLSMWALCNMLAIISPLCSPMFCQLVNLSWINWKVQNCVREAECCWNNLYFKYPFHKIWTLIFKWSHIKSRCYWYSYCRYCVRTWKDNTFHTTQAKSKSKYESLWVHLAFDRVKIQMSIMGSTSGLNMISCLNQRTESHVMRGDDGKYVFLLAKQSKVYKVCNDGNVLKIIQLWLKCYNISSIQYAIVKLK